MAPALMPEGEIGEQPGIVGAAGTHKLPTVRPKLWLRAGLSMDEISWLEGKRRGGRGGGFVAESRLLSLKRLSFLSGGVGTV